MSHAPEPFPPHTTPVAQDYPIGHAFKAMPFARIHLRIGCVLFVALAIEAWEMLILTYVAGDLARDLSLSQTQVGFAISALFLGMIPGALLWGPVSDRIG